VPPKINFLGICPTRKKGETCVTIDVQVVSYF